MADFRTEWRPMACPLCNDVRSVRLMQFGPDVSTLAVPKGTSGLNLVRCRTCSLVYLDFAPTRETMDRMV